MISISISAATCRAARIPARSCRHAISCGITSNHALACISHDARLAPAESSHRTHTPASEFLTASRLMSLARLFVMHCNIAPHLTNYYRKKRHKADYGVIVFLTDSCAPPVAPSKSESLQAHGALRRRLSQSCDSLGASAYSAGVQPLPFNSLYGFPVRHR